MPNSILQFLLVQKRDAALLTTAFGAVLLAHYVPNSLLSYGWNVKTSEPHWHSLFYAGLPIWLKVILLVELFALLSDRLRRSGLIKDGHANPFNKTVILVALLWTFIAEWQNWTITKQLYLANGDEFSIGAPIFSAVISCGGLALAIFIATKLENRWRGYGFWIFYVFNYGLAIPSDIYRTANSVTILNISRLQMIVDILLALVPIVGAVATTALSKSTSGNDNRNQIFLWMLAVFGGWWFVLGIITLQTALTAAGWIVAGVSWPGGISHQHLALLIQAAIILIIGTSYSFISEPKAAKWAHTAILLVTTTAIYLLDRQQFYFGFLYGPDLLVAAWAALALKNTWTTYQQQSTIKLALRRGGS